MIERLLAGSIRRHLVATAAVGVTLTAWQLLVTGPLADEPFATVPEIVRQMADYVDDPSFWGALGETLRVALAGLVIAMLAGVGMGLVVGQSDAAYRSTRLLVEVLKPVPPIVVLPLLVLVLGPTGDMGILLVVLGCVFPLVTQTAHGVHDVDPVASEVARSFRLTRWQRVRTLVLPTALPFIATGIRVSASAALIIALVSEIIGGAPGLGADLVLAQTTGDYPAIYALVVIFGVLGLLINTALASLERRALFWHASIRSEPAA